MKVSPHTHVESPLTGSTIANMVGRAKEMGRTHFAYTDHGHLSSCLKTYALCKPDKRKIEDLQKIGKEYLKKEIKFIPGLEIYFKDTKCPIIAGTSVNRCKYFTATLYCEDQEAYQELCKLVSHANFATVDIYEEKQQLWTWEHLEQISKFNVNMVLGGVHCMVGKPMLADREDLGEMVLTHLKSIFKDKLYISLICEPWMKKWNSIVEIKYTNGTRSTCLTSDLVTTDKARRIKAIDLVERTGHNIVKSISANNTFQDINLTIDKAILHKGFLPFPGGDASLKVNNFLLQMSKKHSIPALVSDYAYYAYREDKIVQTMRLEGNNKLHPNLHMKDESAIVHYLMTEMKLSEGDAAHLIGNNDKWAARFDNLKLKYDWRLAETGGHPLKQAMEIIKKNGRMKWDNPVWVARLKEELEVIAKNPKKDLTAYFLPIRDVLEHYRQNGKLTGPGRGCLTGETKVLANDTYIALKDVKVGDIVVGHSGEKRLVSNTMKYSTEENLLEITSNFSWGSIKLTKDHKLLGIKSTIHPMYADYLSKGHTYKYKGPKIIKIDLNTREWKKAEEFSKGDYLFMPWLKNRKITTFDSIDLSNFCSNITELTDTHIIYDHGKRKIKRWFEFNKESVKIIGRWIGDGWITGNENSKKIGIAYHSKDKLGQEEFLNFLNSYGLSGTLTKHATKQLVQVTVSSAVLVGLFKQLFPNYKYKSNTKYLGKFLFLENSLLSNLLIGLSEADGHIYRSDGKKAIVVECIDTTSKIMAGEIKQALLFLHIPSSINTRKAYLHSSQGYTCKESYKIKFKGLRTPPSKTLYSSKDGYAIKIRKIEERAPEDVYDITVEEDHSYSTSNYVVHNSAGGSLFCYLLGITQVNPFKYDLPFNRFFSMERIMMGKLPDIDVDLEGRELLVGEDGKSGYMYGRWSNKAAQISTRTTIRLKSAIADTNRYFNGKVEDSIEVFTKGLPAPPQGVSDRDFIFGFENEDEEHVPGLIEQSEDLRKYAEDRPKEWDIVSKAMGLTRAFSRHASAFVLSDVPIEDVIPTKDGNITQYEAKECESAGLIKYDFLVIHQLKDIRVCMEMINKRHGVDLEVGKFIHNGKETYIWDLPEIPEVFKSIWNGNTETIFQVNTRSMIPAVVEILPTDIMQIANILALIRPGPVDCIDPKTGRNMVEEYYLRRKGKSEPEIKELAEILPETYGIMIFQEQLGKISRQLAGFSGEDAEKLRENMAKKKKVELMKMKPQFIEGASKKVPRETAETIWEQMETFGRYGFSIIHAVEYALITYASMFLRHYYRLEWWAAILTNAKEQEITSIFWPYVKDMVSAPDINLSSDSMVVDYKNEKIRAKLGIIRGLGDATIEPIVAGRPYKDVQDFVNKDVAGPSLSHKLILVGVLDSLFPPKLSLREKLQMYEDAVENKKFADKLENASLTGKKTRAIEPKKGIVSEEYLNLHPIQDAALKKSILPSMPIDLHSIGKKYSKALAPFHVVPAVISARGHTTPLIDGSKLMRLDEMPGENIEKDIYVASTCYVIKAEEFSYSKGAKRALKLTLDADGYVSDKVLWPDYDSGQLLYPQALKKGAIVTVFFRKKVNKKDMSIQSVIVETEDKKIVDEKSKSL